MAGRHLAAFRARQMEPRRCGRRYRGTSRVRTTTLRRLLALEGLAQLELCVLTFGLAVRPRLDDRGLNGVVIRKECP